MSDNQEKIEEQEIIEEQVKVKEEVKPVKKKAPDIELSLCFTFLMIILVTVDQFLKKIVISEMNFGDIKPVIPDFFSIHYVRNTGSAFSMFADKPWGIYFLSGVSIVLGVAIFVFMLIASSRGFKLLSFAFSLLSAGAFGNLIDRIAFRYVVDFIRFDFGNYTFPIFNFADICAVLGTILVICIIIFGSKYFESFWATLSKKEKSKNAD